MRTFGRIVVGLLIFVPSLVLAQFQELQSLSMSFDNPSEVQVKYYQGFVNDVHDVVLALGFDGEVYKGMVRYQRSGEILYLKGRREHKQLYLEELNDKGETCALISGKLSIGHFEADWENIDKTVSSHWKLKETKLNTIDNQYCGEDKWIYCYKGKLGTISAQIILQKTNANSLVGTVYTEGKQDNLHLIGEYRKDKSIHLVIRDDNRQNIGTIEGRIENAGTFQGTFQEADGRAATMKWDLEKTFPISCIEYADFASSFSAVYPALDDNRAFNDYIYKEVKKWMTQTRQETLKSLVKSGEQHPKDRFSKQAHAWVEITHVSENIVSGYLVGNNTWEGNYFKTFNFDLELNTSLVNNDLFETSPVFQTFVKETITERLKQLPYYKEPEFQGWLGQQKFDQAVIKQGGIEFCSEHHASYGVQKATISYQALKPYLKNVHRLVLR